MRSQACLPSMKPLGMALGVRISYLRSGDGVRVGVSPAPAPPQLLPSSSLPLAELLEDDAVGEALPADADPFQNSVTPQLLQHQMRLQLPGLSGAGETEVLAAPHLCHLGGSPRGRRLQTPDLLFCHGWG